jgi:membrane protein YqaA with SNARE-associated domain
MFEWVAVFAAWLQSWMSPGAGLWGLFFSAFASATILPGSSEVVMSGLVAAYPNLVWWCVLVATAGNVCGAVLSFGMGWAAKQGYERFQRVRIDAQHPLVQRLQRAGPPALLLSFVPLVGDAMVLAAGWFRLPFWPCLFWIALGKAARYLGLALGLIGVLSFLR